MKRVMVMVSIVCAFMAVAGVAPVAAVDADTPVDAEATWAVPDLVGLPEQDAMAALVMLGFVATRVEVTAEGTPDGMIVAQVPPAGSELPVGSEVRFAAAGTAGDPIASAPVVPDLVGLSERDARVALWDAWLTAGERSEVMVADDTVGTILTQEPPPGTAVALGSEVSYQVAAEPFKTALSAFGEANGGIMDAVRACRAVEGSTDQTP